MSGGAGGIYSINPEHLVYTQASWGFQLKTAYGTYSTSTVSSMSDEKEHVLHPDNEKAQEAFRKSKHREDIVRFQLIQSPIRENKAAMKILADSRWLIQSPEHLRSQSDDCIKKDNREAFHNLVSDGHENEWRGGSFSDLFERPDMDHYENVRNKISESGLLRKIETKLININKRQRSLSEHDGEWDPSRQWEIKPFHRAIKKPVKNKFMQIDVDMSILGGTDSSTIKKYCATVWAICNFIEGCGVNVAINLKHEGMSTSSDDEVDKIVVIPVKRPGEYVSALHIARVIHPNFYRRVIFGLWTRGCDILGKTIADGFGRSDQKNYAVRFEKGVLKFAPNVASSAQNEEIAEEILKAITEREAA